MNSKGKVVGYDMLYVTLVSSTSAAINITVDVNGGMLYGTATLNGKGVVSDGKVTGGTGNFSALPERSRSRPLTRRELATPSSSPITGNKSGRLPCRNQEVHIQASGLWRGEKCGGASGPQRSTQR